MDSQVDATSTQKSAAASQDQDQEEKEEEQNLAGEENPQKQRHRKGHSLYPQDIVQQETKRDEQGLVDDIEQLSCKLATPKMPTITPGTAPRIDQDQMPRNVSNTSTLASIVYE